MRMSNRVKHIFNLRNIKRPSRPETQTQTQTRSWTTPPPKHDPYYNGIDDADDDIENAIHISEEEDFSPSSADDASIATPPNSTASSSTASNSSGSECSKRTKNGSKGIKSQTQSTCQRESQTHSKSDGKKGRTVRIITWQVDGLNSGQERPRCRWTMEQERELCIAYQELARCQKAWSSEQEIWLKYVSPSFLLVLALPLFLSPCPLALYPSLFLSIPVRRRMLTKQIKILTEEKEAHEGFLHNRAKQQDDERAHFRKACRRQQQQQQQQQQGESPTIRRARTTTLTTLTSPSSASTSASASSDSEDGNGNGHGVKLKRNQSLRGLGRLRRRLSSMD